MFLTNPVAISVTVLFAIHIVGVANSQDTAQAFKDIKIKLPLLAFPIVLSSFPGYTKLEFKRLIYIFIAAVTLSTIISFLTYWHIIFPDQYVDDIRQISFLISHIRLGLMITLSIMLLVYLFYKNHTQLKPIYALLIFWFLLILYLMESFTGITSLVLGGFILLLIYAYKSKERYLKWLFIITAGAIVLATSIFVKHEIDIYYTINEDKENLAVYSPDGEKYAHDDNDQLENGYYVFKNIAIRELINAWNQRSDINFFESDQRGNKISGTIIRYMTSKGLHKDKYGVSQLTDKDIQNIENGIANVHHTSGGFRKRIQKAIFQLDVYFKHNNPGNSSIAQRLEYWKTGISIIAKNALFGVGTGDAQLSFEKAYIASNTKLPKENWKRAHNQYLTFFITFGVIGILIFLTVIFIPFFQSTVRVDFYFMAFIVIAALSFIWEDTLETQAGVTFFTFFYCLLLMGRQKMLPAEINS